MGIRGMAHRFMPNRLVFPGGAVDRTDGTAAAATEPSATLLAALEQLARPRLARALAVCAARELEEETGITLGRPPRLGGLRYLCRAVTPPSSPIRFNARFLLVQASETEGEPRDSQELQEVGFRSIDDAMELDLALVTREVLHRLRARLSDGEQPAATATRMVFLTQSWVADH